MQLDDFSGSGFLRRWHLIDGQPRCPFDAVEPGWISAIDQGAILKQNAAVRAALADVEAYEAALLLRAGETPERYEEAINPETQEPERRETAAYKAWRSAKTLIDAASDDTLALAQIRAGVDAEGEPIEPEPLPEDTLVVHEPASDVPASVSETQFMRAATRIKLVTGDEAEAYLARGVIPSFVATALDHLPATERTDARLKVIGANTFERADPVFALLIASGVATAEQVNGLFQLADTLV